MIVMSLKRQIIIVLLTILSFSCNRNPSSPDGDTFLELKSFSFTAPIDSGSLKQETNIALYSSFHFVREDSYTIQTAQDLADFNSLVDGSEQVSLSNLNSITYFLFRGPFCSEYFQYYDHSYTGGTLTIRLAHYRKENIACTALVYDNYYVFSGNKL